MILAFFYWAARVRTVGPREGLKIEQIRNRFNQWLWLQPQTPFFYVFESFRFGGFAKSPYANRKNCFPKSRKNREGPQIEKLPTLNKHVKKVWATATLFKRFGNVSISNEHVCYVSNPLFFRIFNTF